MDLMDEKIRNRKHTPSVTLNENQMKGSGIVSKKQFQNIKWRTIGLLYLTYGCYYLPRKADAIVKVSLQKESSFTVDQLAMSDTSYLFVYTFALFLSGMIGSRVPSYIMLSVGLLGVAFTSFLKGSTNDPYMYAFYQGLHAIFQSSGWPTCIKLLSVWVTHNRGFIMGIWTTCQSLGGVLGAVYATFIITNHPWQSAYYNHIPILVIVALLNFFFIKDDLPMILGPNGIPQLPEKEDDITNVKDDKETTKIHVNNDKSEDSKDLNDIPPTLSQILVLPGVASVGIAYFFLKFLRYALLFWLPYYYREGLGYDKSISGYISTSFELGGLIGTPLIGYVSDKFMNKKRDIAAAVFMTFAGLMLGLCITVSSLGVTINAICMVFVGIGVIGPDSVLSGTIAQDIGTKSGLGKLAVGQIAGLVNSIGSAGSIFQSSATAYISKEYGWSVLFGVFFVCAFVSAGVLFRFAAMSPDRKSSSR